MIESFAKITALPWQNCDDMKMCRHKQLVEEIQMFASASNESYWDGAAVVGRIFNFSASYIAKLWALWLLVNQLFAIKYACMFICIARTFCLMDLCAASIVWEMMEIYGKIPFVRLKRSLHRQENRFQAGSSLWKWLCYIKIKGKHAHFRGGTILFMNFLVLLKYF